RHADADDLPLQLVAARSPDPGAHRLAQPLDVLGGGVAVVDQEVAVHVRDLRTADAQAAAAGPVDEPPAALARRVFEGGAAGALLARLVRLAVLGPLVHVLEDRRLLPGAALVERLREDPVAGHAAVAVGHAQVRERQDVQVAPAVHRLGLDQRVLGLAAVGAGVHAQRAPNRAGNAPVEGEPGDARVGGGAGELRI